MINLLLLPHVIFRPESFITKYLTNTRNLTQSFLSKSTTMLSPRAIFLPAALMAGIASAANITFYSDFYCSAVQSTVQLSDNLVCHTLPSPLPQSAIFHLSDFESADLVGTVYTSANCSSACGDSYVEVENESPNPEYPIANGQCVAALSIGTTFGSYQFSSFR